MLASAHRMRRSGDVRATVRDGVRAGRRRLLVHLAPGEPGPITAGFAVSRSVGTAVVRNRVRRRLRHLVAQRLDRLPAGTRLVVRALPAAGSATFAELAADLDGALGTALRRSRP